MNWAMFIGAILVGYSIISFFLALKWEVTIWEMNVIQKLERKFGTRGLSIFFAAIGAVFFITGAILVFRGVGVWRSYQ